MALIVEPAQLLASIRMPNLRMRQITGLALLTALCGCSESPSGHSDWRDDADRIEAWAGRDNKQGSDSSAISDEEALERAVADHEGVAYDDLGRPYGCTEDCSGHEAGVAWAQDNDIRDPLDCGGRSRSFIEGCETYAESIQQAAGDLADGG